MADRVIIAAAARAAQGKTAEAVAMLRRAASGRGDPLPYLLLLSECLAAMGQLDAALYAAVQATARSPGLGNAARGLVYQTSGRLEEAAAAFAEAVRLAPDLAMAHQNLGLVLQALARYADAGAALRRADELEPSPLSAGNLSLLLSETGRVPEAIALLGAALGRWPGTPGLLFNLCFALNYSDTASAADVLARHKEYGCAITPPGAVLPRVPRGPRPPVLRVGLVSGDLRGHSVARFIAPVLRRIDRERFEFTCYFTGARGDDATARLRALAARWRDAARTHDDELRATIARDRIDILVDLAGLTAGQRLPVFARRAAPVQATWIGYPHTTGVPAMDFRLVDPITDPPGADALATERLVRLSGCLLCYEPDAGSPAPRPREDGPIRFGSYNALPTISATCMDLWARVLAAVPGSRLLLKAKALVDPGTRERVESGFAARGVAPERIEMLGQTGTTAEHLALYHRVDVALDTFPYHGATTTCEALWMGVPVVTLRGPVHAARVGPSLLTAAGLRELIAETPESLVRLARDLVRDPARLGVYRAALRDRLAASALCDAPSYVRGVESALDGMWSGPV
jgi:predicted O-linked N-acetylglucosamine transferase (SPINDLY family)